MAEVARFVSNLRRHGVSQEPEWASTLVPDCWKRGGRASASVCRHGRSASPSPTRRKPSPPWARALDSAQTRLQASLAADQAVLAEERSTLHRERETWGADATALRAQTEAAAQAERLASAQVTELQRLVRRLEGQLEDLTRQRDDAAAREAEARCTTQALEARLQDLQNAAQSERTSLAAHVQMIENRAHAEVDRARQEAKAMQGRLMAASQEWTVIEKSLRQSVDASTAAAVEASRNAGIERARADTLERQLGKLQDLLAALEAAMRRREPPHKARKRARRVPAKQP